MPIARADLPLVDLSSSDTAAVAALIDRACRETGFLVVVGHGVPGEVVREAFEAGFAFFDAPQALKDSAIPPDRRVRGYTPLGGQRLAASLQRETPPDLFERFRMGPFDVPDEPYFQARAQGWFAPNVWPGEMPGLRQALEAYYRAMARLASDLMGLFAQALGLPAGTFAPTIDRAISSLCLNHYPALQHAPEPGQLRAGEHTDYGSLTIVAPSDAPGRLQILARDGRWVEVDPPPGQFVVNIGDLMARWTNDRWVSTLHRVGLPDDAQAAAARRLSRVFFHQPNDDARIECLPTCLPAGASPRYAPITSGEHLRLKIDRHLPVSHAPRER